MSFKRFLNSHFVFGNKNHISFLQGSSFRFAVIISTSYILENQQILKRKRIHQKHITYSPLVDSHLKLIYR